MKVKKRRTKRNKKITAKARSTEAHTFDDMVHGLYTINSNSISNDTLFQLTLFQIKYTLYGPTPLWISPKLSRRSQFSLHCTISMNIRWITVYLPSINYEVGATLDLINFINCLRCASCSISTQRIICFRWPSFSIPICFKSSCVMP